jgi:GDP-D-mannose 3',5'-epimerase
LPERSCAIKHIDGPLGVRGRNSDNRLIREKLGWEAYSCRCATGLGTTYAWVAQQVAESVASANR